jgi:cell division protein FtsQ
MSKDRAQPDTTRRVRRKNTVQAPDEVVEHAEGEQRRGGAWVVSVAKMVAFLLTLVVAVGGFAYGANRFFVSTSRFSIEKVEAEGNRRFSDATLLRLAGISRGDNLFALDLEAAERQLASDPWIESAQITRRIPDTVSIAVTEHTAAALASLDGVLYLVTREGLPIKTVAEGDSADYPVVTGVTAEDLKVDRERGLERVAFGIALLKRYERLPLARAVAAQEIHMDSDGSVRLVVGSSGITFHLGKGPFRQKLLMAARVLDKVRARRQTPQIVFLDNQAHPERVVVRMR